MYTDWDSALCTLYTWSMCEDAHFTVCTRQIHFQCLPFFARVSVYAKHWGLLEEGGGLLETTAVVPQTRNKIVRGKEREQ